MAPQNDARWLITENVPQLSDDLERRLEHAIRFGGLNQEIIDEVDEVILAATKAIRKHYEQLAWPSAKHNCSKS